MMDDLLLRFVGVWGIVLVCLAILALVVHHKSEPRPLAEWVVGFAPVVGALAVSGCIVSIALAANHWLAN